MPNLPPDLAEFRGYGQVGAGHGLMAPVDAVLAGTDPTRTISPATLKLYLDEKGYVPGGGGSAAFSIASFAGDWSPLREEGSALTAGTLSWTYSGSLALASQTIAGPGLGGAVAELRPNGDRSLSLTGLDVLADSTWTLQAVAGGITVQATAAIAFGRRLFFGRGGSSDLDETAIEALGSSLRTGRASTWSVVANGGAGAFVWFAWPDAWSTGFAAGTSIVDAATGFNVPFQDAGTLTITNAFGSAATYRRVRSVNGLNGALTLRIN